jgi:hypothetical protein
LAQEVSPKNKAKKTKEIKGSFFRCSIDFSTSSFSQVRKQNGKVRNFCKEKRERKTSPFQITMSWDLEAYSQTKPS